MIENINTLTETALTDTRALYEKLNKIQGLIDADYSISGGIYDGYILITLTTIDSLVSIEKKLMHLAVATNQKEYKPIEKGLSK